MNCQLSLMCGIDIPIPECQLVVHQPTIREIAFIGEKQFFLGAQCICVNKLSISQDKSVLDNTSNFQIFMMIVSNKETQEKKEAIKDVFSLVLPDYKIIFTPRSIIAQNKDIQAIIDENNFEYLQSTLKKIFCFDTNSNQDSFNPQGEKAKEIANKLMRGRQRIAEEKGDSEGSPLVRYLSILTIGLNSMSFSDNYNLTLFQLYDLVQRYMLFVNWDLDIKTRLAGGKPDSQPDNWMKNIH